MQGLPGAGKDRWIRRNLVNPRVCSTDLFPGLYPEPGKIDASKLGQAHAWCLRQFIEAINSPAGVRPVVVNNTNLGIAEIAPYIAVARAFGIEPEVVRLHVTPELAAARNIHGVPLEVTLRMEATFERTIIEWPPFWPKTVGGDRPCDQVKCEPALACDEPTTTTVEG